jgi:hypothetical protein
MVKFIKGFTTGGKIVMIMCLISLIGAFILHRYTGLPFLILAFISACISMRK